MNRRLRHHIETREMRRTLRRCLVAVRPSVVVTLACAATLGLTACGNTARGPVVAVVDGFVIHAETVGHWAGVRARGGVVAVSGASAGKTPHERALTYLISSRWLLGEVADQGMSVSNRAVRGRLRELKEAVPGGDATFAESLRSTGETVADVELEIRTELAHSSIEKLLASRLAATGQAKLLRYYRAHRERYRVPERRDIDIVEHLTSPAAARRLAVRVGSGLRFTHIAYQESPTRPASFGANDKAAVERAIFSIESGVLSGPMRLGNGYALFIVRRVVPSSVQSFAQVRAAIASKLTARERRHVRDAFVESYRRRWLGLTDCKRGNVVPGCRQYTGSEPPNSLFGEG